VSQVFNFQMLFLSPTISVKARKDNSKTAGSDQLPSANRSSNNH